MKKALLITLSNLDIAVASIALIALTLLTSFGVFMRYVVKNPILWQEEISAFCQVWIVFLGGSAAFRTGGHVAIEIVSDALPERGRKILSHIVDLIVLVVMVYLLMQCRGYINQVFGKSGRLTPILRIPYVYIYGIAPYGCALMLISYFFSRYRELTGKAEEGEQS